jgi:hypothetical protein
MNVVENWRNRARALRAEYWRCAACGAFASVRRLVCTHCGAKMAASRPAPLPKTMYAVAFSHAHLVVETMDQVEGLRPVMLMRTPDGQHLALPLCEADAGLGMRLVGEGLELVLRRSQTDGGPDEAIAYVRKVASSVATRARLKRNETKSR